MTDTLIDCSHHKGHRRFVGGSKDGHVDHLIHAHPSDFPQTIGTMSLGTQLLGSQRSWYELDYDASEGAEVVYRFVGLGRRFPMRQVSA